MHSILDIETARHLDLFADIKGATAVEYGLIAALVSVAGIVALQAMGGSLDFLFQSVSTTLLGAVTP